MLANLLHATQKEEPMSEKIAAVIGALLIIVIVCLLLALPTWLLWNWLMPSIFAMKKITILQAIGLNFLSAILFKSSCNCKSGS